MTRLTIILSFIFIGAFLQAQELTGTEIMTKADQKLRGLTNKTLMSMTIERPTWSRTIEMKSWAKGQEYSLVIITSPAKEKGQTFLKRENDMWNWIPQISRMIKLPPSMMSQGWMGSDYSNDDILKESSIIYDYNHTLLGSEKYDGYDCYKLKLLPKEEAAVVWGKIIKLITKDEFLQIKTLYYDEEGFLIKTELASDIKLMDDRKIPTYIEIIPNEEKGNKTVLKIKSVEFNIDFKKGFFSQQNMKRAERL
ncbi:MAG: outer membrane lipoprotein-sorting protein [Bacteroidota bacterium]|nr:outer membrane lipoprotein-sorting protein [Bacteroidota bacterium]